MSFINWGHETPEQKEIRRRMEERMLFEQMAYNAAVATAAAGSGALKKNYVTSGRSSLSSFVEDGEYKYYTYNYESDTLNSTKLTGLFEADYSDRIYVLQDKGFVMRYNGNPERVYIFMDINGETIKKITIDETKFDSYGQEYNDGVNIIVYTVLGNTVTLYVFDGETVKTYTIDNVYMYGPGNGDWYTRSTDNGGVVISWRSSNSSTYYLGLTVNGELQILDSIVSGVESWYINSQWNSNFITVLRADYSTGVYQSFKVFGNDGTLKSTTDLSSYGQTSVRRSGIYGNNKFFFILGGAYAWNDIWAYDGDTNTIKYTQVSDADNKEIEVVYHIHNSTNPNGMSNYDDSGIIGINLSNDLLIIFHNTIGYFNDSHYTQWSHVDSCRAYTLFDGDDAFYSYDMVGAGLTAVKLDDHESLMRSFGEDQSIVLDAFTWNEGSGNDQSGEFLSRLSIKSTGTQPEYHVVGTTLGVNSNAFHDKFFLGNRLVCVYYDGIDDHLQWLAINSDGMTNPTQFVITPASQTNYYRTHDTLVIIDNGGDVTYMVNQWNGQTFTNLNTETGIWYNEIFISDKNGDGSISPTTEYAFYPNNTGWGSIILVHDIAIDDADYGKAIIIQQNDYFQFTLPMVYGNSWTGELGHNTFLFAWNNNIGGWSANLYDLEGNILSGTNISVDAGVTYDIELWNLNDRAIISLIPDITNGNYFHYHFSHTNIATVGVGQNDYWWENDFPAWYY